MEMKLSRLELTNFKGIKHKEILLDGKKALIKGQNGAGKSTVGSCLSWIISDTDIELNKSPMVTPLGEPECTTRVEAELTLDEKPVTIAKIQKFKSKVDDEGKVTSSVTNSYEINGIAKSQRDFLADLTERGIDVDRFMVFTNPNQFTADTSKKGREQMREILFKMADEITDEEIADEIGANDVKALLEKGYKLDEVEQMNKATIKKFVDACGKYGELIDAKIEGLLTSKETVDVKALTEQRTTLESRLSDIDNLINGSSDKTSAIKKRLADIEMEIKDIGRKADREYQLAISNKLHEINALDAKIKVTESRKTINQNELTSLSNSIKSLEESLNGLRTRYKLIQDEVFDEEKTVCPTCKRRFSEKKVEQIKEGFEKSKAERLEICKKEAEETKAKIADLQKEYNDADAEGKNLGNQITELQKEYETLTDEQKLMPTRADISNDENYLNLSAEKDELEKQLADEWINDNSKLVDERAEVKGELDQVIAEFALDDHNKKVDVMVAELRQEKKDSEIKKAHAERIIDQVTRVKNAKDDKLTESINKSFSKVRWVLFENQRNGDRKEVCEPYINDKPMSTCANGSLKTIAKISICADIQRHMGVTYPIVVDDYTLFSANSIGQIDVGDSQLIGLVVSEDEELQIVKGE